MNDVTGTPQSNRKVSWFFPSSAAIRLVAIKLLTLTLTLVAALWVWLTPARADGPTFNTVRTFGGVNNTNSVAVGDLNGDGFLDIVEGNFLASGGQQSYVYLNDGTGGFLSASPFGGTNGTRSVVMGDLNGDGFLDIVEG
ncbi:MAG: VCBS repeat-containing protein, partial [Anaerolineales bacterium]|nr:VCBS repeat-containing protein [Anaerolineales bacterium]